MNKSLYFHSCTYSSCTTHLPIKSGLTAAKVSRIQEEVKIWLKFQKSQGQTNDSFSKISLHKSTKKLILQPSCCSFPALYTCPLSHSFFITTYHIKGILQCFTCSQKRAFNTEPSAFHQQHAEDRCSQYLTPKQHCFPLGRIQLLSLIN